jgi:NAD-dependent deacetylase
VLARWQSRFSAFTLITQNVDGLHERAGSTPLIRYHGSIWRLQCSIGCGAGAWEDLRAPLPELPPRCPHCHGLARPGVVWFGEPIPPDAARDASHAATNCDVFLTVGTSSIVYPAAGLVHQAARAGAFTAEINVEATEASARVNLAIAAPAEQVLPQIDVSLRTGGL